MLLRLIIVYIILVSELFSENSNQVVRLNFCELSIPSNYNAKKDKIDLVIHLHGKSSVVQEALYKCSLNIPLITIHLGSLSSPYRDAFSDTSFLSSIIKEAIDTISNIAQIPLQNIPLNIILTSFSAGYGGVREILKNEFYYQIISTIILLDGLHTDYIVLNGQKHVNIFQMKDFLRFAQDATKFRKQLIITHSQIIPDGYSSTTETAQYLIDYTDTEKIFSEKHFDDGFIQNYYAINGDFKVFGFYGNTATDHMKHFYNLDKFLRMISIK